MSLIHPAIPASRPPAYYIRQRLWRNQPAMLCLAFIILAALIAVLDYLILPDSTLYANNSIVELQKKMPGFSVQVLRIPNSYISPSPNLFQKLLFGQEK